ncbi:MAG: hypothetical protein D6752_02175 [Candidatus Nitrosothermus koennekii]|nr:MAG: hypothetical protein D6752_02175 [Candidatus Nitrosothermus koennekii]
MNKELFVFPGDKLASIEEFEGKEGTYEDDGIVRAKVSGKAIYDFKNRVIKVIPVSKNITLPKPGDIVLGLVIMATPSMVEMKILYVNDEKQEVNLNAIYFSRSRRNTQFRVGDLVRAKVTNLLNSFIHVTFKDKKLGVVYTLCHLCGGKMVKIDHSLKCTECNNKDDRKVAEDFGEVKGLLPLYRGMYE